MVYLLVKKQMQSRKKYHLIVTFTNFVWLPKRLIFIFKKILSFPSTFSSNLFVLNLIGLKNYHLSMIYVSNLIN